MSGGKGGSQTTKVEIPQWLEDAARKNIARGEGVATLGYVPYYGPDVAAFTPMQNAAFENTNSAASAFGLAAPVDSMSMPTARTYANGLSGYSSGGLYDQAVSELKNRRPGQYDAMTGMFINPQTGAQPLSPYGPGQLPGADGAPPGGSGSPAPASPIVGGGRDKDGINVFDLVQSRPRPSEPIITTPHSTFGADLRASLFDPTYDPPGTVLSRAMGVKSAPPPANGKKTSGSVPVPPPRPASIKPRSGR